MGFKEVKYLCLVNCKMRYSHRCFQLKVTLNILVGKNFEKLIKMLMGEKSQYHQLVLQVKIPSPDALNEE